MKENTQCVRTYAHVCACGSRVAATHLNCDVQIKYCCVKYTLYNILLHVLIFQRNDDSVINLGRIIHTGNVHACTYSAYYNESVLCLFVLYGKNRK